MSRGPTTDEIIFARYAVAELLYREGALSARDIRKKLHFTKARVYRCLKHPWFTAPNYNSKVYSPWELTIEGRKEFEQLERLRA